MSWLYTIVFAGLMFSSQGNTVSVPERAVQTAPPATEQVQKDETEKFEQTYPLSSNGRVSVSNVNGSIVVEAWDRNEVKLEYTKIADTKERLADVEVRIDAKPDYFSVETDYGDWKIKGSADKWRNGGKLNVEYHLTVPRTATLNEIEAVNGSVTVSNFTNYTKVSAVNGSVNATNIRGTARLSTVNGEVTADFDRLETGSKISLETVNGKAHLIIPSDANATVKADTLNGSIANDFGLPVRKGKYVGRDLHGRIGNGDVQIRLNSVNGGLTIGHKNDGKALSPATNLLEKKDKDDDDWDKDDGDEDSLKQTAKVNKEIAKAVKEGTKVSAKAIADAQVEINNMGPEIARITADSITRSAEAIENVAKIYKSDEMNQNLKAIQADVAAKVVNATFFPSVPKVEKKSHSIPVKGVPKVTIDAKGCSVKVFGWDKSEVQYVLTSFSRTRNGSLVEVKETVLDSDVNLKVIRREDTSRNTTPPSPPAPAQPMLPDNVENISINGKTAVVNLKGGTVRVFNLKDPKQKSDFDREYGGRSRSYGPNPMPTAVASPSFGPQLEWFPDGAADLNRVHIEVYVPQRSNLKIISDGEIRLEGVSGDIDLTGYDESINVRDVDGKLQVSSSDGRIRVIGFKGEIVASSDDGMINLEGDFQKLKAKASEGSIFVTVPDNAQADVEATCDDVQGEGLPFTRVSGNDKSSRYRIGKGGSVYQIETEGEIRVRALSTLKESF